MPSLPTTARQRTIEQLRRRADAALRFTVLLACAGGVALVYLALCVWSDQ